MQARSTKSLASQQHSYVVYATASSARWLDMEVESWRNMAGIRENASLVSNTDICCSGALACRCQMPSKKTSYRKWVRCRDWSISARRGRTRRFTDDTTCESRPTCNTATLILVCAEVPRCSYEALRSATLSTWALTANTFWTSDRSFYVAMPACPGTTKGTKRRLRR